MGLQRGRVGNTNLDRLTQVIQHEGRNACVAPPIAHGDVDDVRVGRHEPAPHQHVTVQRAHRKVGILQTFAHVYPRPEIYLVNKK
jgi:hypothetical protein